MMYVTSHELDRAYIYIWICIIYDIMCDWDKQEIIVNKNLAYNQVGDVRTRYDKLRFTMVSFR